MFLPIRIFIYYYCICIEYTYFVFVFGDIAETLTTIASGLIVVNKAQKYNIH